MREIPAPAAAGNPPGLCGFAFCLCDLFPCPVASGGLLSRRGESRQRHAKGNRVVARVNSRYPAFGRIPARFPRLLLLKSKRLLRFEKDVSTESFRCWPIRLTPDIPVNKDAAAAPLRSPGDYGRRRTRDGRRETKDGKYGLPHPQRSSFIYSIAEGPRPG